LAAITIASQLLGRVPPRVEHRQVPSGSSLRYFECLGRAVGCSRPFRPGMHHQRRTRGVGRRSEPPSMDSPGIPASGVPKMAGASLRFRRRCAVIRTTATLWWSNSRPTGCKFKSWALNMGVTSDPVTVVPNSVCGWRRSYGTRGGTRCARVHRAILLDPPQLKLVR